RRAHLKALVKAKRNKLWSGKAPTPAGYVDINPDSRVNIVGAIQMAQVLGEDFAMEWTMADNSDVALDAEGMLQMGMAVAMFINEVQAHKRTLTAALDAVDAEAEDRMDLLDAIDINAGWPE